MRLRQTIAAALIAAQLLLFPLIAWAGETAKVLGQVNPSATTATTLYTVPGSTSTVVSTITVANQAAAAGTYRIAIRVAGAALAATQYIAYDVAVGGNDTALITLGLTLAATDVVTVYASSATMSFGAFGVEIQ